METYSMLREFADSWMLLALFLVFVGVWFWVWRPGSRDSHNAAANSIFRNENRPGEPSSVAQPAAEKEAR